MNLKTLKVIYNCLALLLVADVLISYFLKDSLIRIFKTSL